MYFGQLLIGAPEYQESRDQFRAFGPGLFARFPEFPDLLSPNLLRVVLLRVVGAKARPAKNGGIIEGLSLLHDDE